MRALFTALLCLVIMTGMAQRVRGVVYTANRNPLPYASITLKGLGTGVSANVDGEYQITLSPGKYVLQCQHVGYFTVEQQVTVDAGRTATLNFTLQPQVATMKDVAVNSGQDDPAFAIIRQAIAKRSANDTMLADFQADVYLKGQIKLRSYPKRFLGRQLNFERGDTALNKQIYLSETIGRYSRQSSPDREKTEVYSTRVSGNSEAYGFSKINWYSPYKNQILFSENLHPRGFMSPVADNALKFYNYRFLGEFQEGENRIFKIEVSPKRAYEPVFKGIVNIVDGSFQFHSLRLVLTKPQLLQVLDTLVMEQVMAPLEGQWMLRQQVMIPYLHILKFRADGGFLQTFNHVQLNPDYPKDFFTNTVLTYADSANRKPFTYWDTMRPVPLQPEEIADYRIKDSTARITSRPAYMDSVDRKSIWPGPFNFVLKGTTINRRTRERKIVLPAVLDVFTYNTVEGFAIRFSPEYYKGFQKNREDELYLSPHVQYGFNNKAFNAHLTGYYRWGGKYFSQLSWSGGRRMFQFNNDQPIAPRDNTSSTLLFENNWMKFYYAWTGRLGFSKGIGDGLVVSLNAEYQDRIPLENTTDYVLFDNKTRSYTPNRTYEVSLTNIPRHQAVTATAEITWQPGGKYIEYVNRRENLGSKWPTFRLAVTQAIKGIAGGDADYTRWRLRIDDIVRLGLGGRFEYNAAVGGFITDKQVYLPDYQHYFSTQSFLYTPNSMMFLLPTFYQFSNKAGVNAELHFDYHLAGLLTNKIPGFNKLNWFLVAGTNALYLDNRTRYVEALIGLENILKIGRVDFVYGQQNSGWNRSAIRVTLSGLAAAKKDD